MGHQTLNLPAVLEGRDAWITAYAAWYHHFLAMQPQDHLAGPWAQDMTEASLVQFHLRDDQAQIRQAALRIPVPASELAPAFAAPAPCRGATLPNAPKRPTGSETTPQKTAQIDLFS
jgi:hypothetical protein